MGNSHSFHVNHKQHALPRNKSDSELMVKSSNHASSLQMTPMEKLGKVSLFFFKFE